MTSPYRAARQAREREAKAILARMKAKHPAAFPKLPRPFKVGIREDFLAAGWTEAEVSLALGHYLKTEPYLRQTVAEGAFRIDLKGHPVAPVQPHEASWARQQITWLPFTPAGGGAVKTPAMSVRKTVPRPRFHR